MSHDVYVTTKNKILKYCKELKMDTNSCLIGSFNPKPHWSDPSKACAFKSTGAYPGDFLLLLFLYSQKAGAVDGNHNFLQRCQQILLLLPLAGRTLKHTSHSKRNVLKALLTKSVSNAQTGFFVQYLMFFDLIFDIS